MKKRVPPKKMSKADIKKHNKNYEKKQKEPTYARLLKKTKSPKDGMTLLDDTFKYLKQRPPAMHAHMQDPSSRFLIEVYELIAKWPDGVLKQFIADLTNLEPPKDTAGMLGTVKRIIHEIFDDKGLHTGAPYLARWRMWPHRRDTVQDEVHSKPEKEGRENIMASKMATKKKVESKKGKKVEAEVKKPKIKAKKSEGSRSQLTDDTMLKRTASSTKESKKFSEFLAAMPDKPIAYKALVALAKKSLKIDEKKTRRFTLSLRRRSLIVDAGA